MKCDDCRGQLIENEPLRQYSSWKVGGPARYFYKPADLDDLQHFLRQCPVELPLLWLGLGSNSLFRDGGFPGVVIHTLGALQRLAMHENQHVYAQAGVSCASLARFCARQNLAAAEFWAGIPGTVGGALRMNAGCFNGETWDSVVSVTMINRQGDIVQRSKAEFAVAYRSVEPPQQEWFVAAEFSLPQGEKETSLQTIRDLLERRSQTQPTGDHTCGSVFRNPPGDHAGRLIESCGLKGFRIGGAAVSAKHANFIVNDQDASAADIEALIAHVQHHVHQHTGVNLHPEVHIIGEKEGEHV